MGIACVKDLSITINAAPSLLGYWKCDEASPIAQLNDSTAGAWHMPKWVGIDGVSTAGKIGTALEMGLANRSFNGWPSNAHWIYDSFTIRFWYKPELGDAGIDTILFNNDDSYNIDRWEDAGTIVMEMLCRTDGGTESVDSGVLTLSAWNRVVAWFEDGVGLGIKINNDAPVLFATASPLNPLAAHYPWVIMSHFTAAEAIDEIALWNRKLTDAEMLYDWNSGAGRTYPDVPL